MPEQHLRRLGHQGGSEGITLIGAQIMAVIPAAAD